MDIYSVFEKPEQFSEIVDVRSPGEFQDDHIPGAINLPVLSDEERSFVGTLYKKDSFEGKKLGAELICKNVSKMFKSVFNYKNKDWQPLIYCQRGGERSKSLATILLRTGFKTYILRGGYKSYRRYVINELEKLANKMEFQVICGLTGSGKTKLLTELNKYGLQTLDLEEIAKHYGSLLGQYPSVNQPGQKQFESNLLVAMLKLNAKQRVFVESESRKIGNRQVPTAIIKKMRSSACLWIQMTMEERINFLLREYTHFVKNPDRFLNIIAKFEKYLDKNSFALLVDSYNKRHWEEFVKILLQKHYDPSYLKSINNNFTQFKKAQIFKSENYSGIPELHRAMAESVSKTFR
ncbi:tRNA 2-selenouridine(34) synthase MnmH [Betaproteobacteria bacterium]|nr:tRNA 2-selenouridine(34) synthase MnmH [Betaproteobacteria bacterium]